VYKFDPANWSQADRIAGGATAVLLVSLFLTWFTASATIQGVTATAGGSGLTAHGYLYLVMILCLVVLADLVLRAGWGQIPFKIPVTHDQFLSLLTGLNFVIVLIAFVFKPSGDGVVTVSWSYGAFIGLIAALVALAPLAAPVIQARQRN
jgi:hypothetical protein